MATIVYDFFMSCWLDFGYSPDIFHLKLCYRHNTSWEYDIFMAKEKE